MIYGKPISTTSAELERLEREELEVLEREAMKAAQQAAPDALVDERLTELERLAAADLVMKMRNVEQLSRDGSDQERAKFAEIFERTARQFDAAALRLKRVRVATEIPDYLREGSDVPMLLRRQAD